MSRPDGETVSAGQAEDAIRLACLEFLEHEAQSSSVGRDPIPKSVSLAHELGGRLVGKVLSAERVTAGFGQHPTDLRLADPEFLGQTPRAGALGAAAAEAAVATRHSSRSPFDRSHWT